VSASLLDAIDRALSSRSLLEIDYHSIAEDKRSNRVISPIEKVRRDGHDFLIAFCTTADSRRTFRLDRITKAEITEPSADLSLQREITSDRLVVTLRVHHNARAVMETFDICRGLGDGRYEVEIFNTNWLIREVLASGGDIEILEPGYLRSEVLGQSREIGLHYR
jgi:proteasome accessory factor C